MTRENLILRLFKTKIGEIGGPSKFELCLIDIIPARCCIPFSTALFCAFSARSRVAEPAAPWGIVNFGESEFGESGFRRKRAEARAPFC